MAAYASHQRERAARLLHLNPDRPKLDPLAGIKGGSLMDELFDELVDRVAAAVVAHMAADHKRDQDEWLDSRQAAEYLGLHRDTLRRLAAADAIPSEQDGRGCKLFFRRTALDEWRRSGCHPRHLAAVAAAA
jgi:excisionase family DNA binding protein